MEGDAKIELYATLLEQHGSQVPDQAVIGDLADLSMSAGRLLEAVKRLESLEDSSPDQESVQAALGALTHEVSHMRLLCEDLAAPLDELSADSAGAEAIIRATVEAVDETLSSFSSPASETLEEDH